MLGRLIWALYTADLPSGQIAKAGLEMATADPTTHECPTSLSEVRKAVKKLKVQKAADTFDNSTKMMKAESDAMLHWLRYSSAIPQN